MVTRQTGETAVKGFQHTYAPNHWIILNETSQILSSCVGGEREQLFFDHKTGDF